MPPGVSIDIHAGTVERRARHIEVREDASIGDFTIHIDDPFDWAKVGSVIAGEIFGETDRPTVHAGSATSGHFSRR